MDVNQTESLIREKLENTGQMNKMRAMVIDASLRAIAGSSAADAQELFSVSPNMQKLRSEDPEALKQVVSIAVEALQWLGLAYSANVVSVESGIKPTELTKREGLAAALGLSTAAGASSLIAQLAQGGGARSSSVGAANNNNNTTVGNLSAVGNNTSAAQMTSFGSANLAPAAAPAANNTSAATNASSAAANTTTASVGNPADFEDVTAEKIHKWSENSKHTISRWKGRTFKRHNQVKGDPMNIDYLEDCKLVVLDDMDSTNIDDCKNTVFVFASVANSIFLRTSENCIVYAACKQFRVRDCTNCEIRLFAGTDPVVETSSNITFKPFNLRLPGLKQSFKNAHLDPAMNRYVHVYDFNADDAKYPEPHFVVNHDHHGLEMEDWCSEDGEPECPVEIEMLLDGRLEPAASVESGQNKSHNIKTGANAWTAPPAAAEEAPAAPPAAAPASEGEDNYSDYESSSASSSQKYSHSEDDDEF